MQSVSRKSITTTSVCSHSPEWAQRALNVLGRLDWRRHRRVRALLNDRLMPIAKEPGK